MLPLFGFEPVDRSGDTARRGHLSEDGVRRRVRPKVGRFLQVLVLSGALGSRLPRDARLNAMLVHLETSASARAGLLNEFEHLTFQMRKDADTTSQK